MSLNKSSQKENIKNFAYNVRKNIRRGWPTINKIWKNKISILVGDYMFSKALINITELNDF